MVEIPKSQRPTQGCQATDDDDCDNDKDDIHHLTFFNFQCPAFWCKITSNLPVTYKCELCQNTYQN